MKKVADFCRFRAQSHAIRQALFAGCTLTLFSCSMQTAGSEIETNASELTSTTPPAPATRRVAIGLPQGVGLESVAAAANDWLHLDSRAEIASAGNTGVLLNTGTHEIAIATSARVSGNVSSVGLVTVASGARVEGYLRSAATVRVDSGGTVVGTIEEHAALSPVTQSWSVTIPTICPDFQITFGTKTLQPGSYGSVIISPGATLRMSAGTYFFTNLIVSPLAKVVVDGTAGPVIAYVTTTLQPAGKIETIGGDDRFLITYLGTTSVTVSGTFVATIVAPEASVSFVASVPATTHVGAVFARRIAFGASVKFVLRPFRFWERLFPTRGANCLRSVQMLAAGRDGLGGMERWFAFAGDRSLVTNAASAGTGWGDGVKATAVAWGDVDGDGNDEIAVGRSEITGPRVIIYDDRETGFEPLRELLAGWGSSFRVTALAFGNIDGDSKLELAVARNANSGPEVVLLDDIDHGFQIMREIDVGDRDANDLAFGDVDGDGRNELLIARGGRSGSAPGRVVVVQDASENFAERSFAEWGDEDRSATSVAIGDLDGDGRREIAVGRSSGTGTRTQIYRYKPASSTASDVYENIADWNQGWGSSRYVTALEFADLDDDGKDELIVGRNGGCVSCVEDPRIIVFKAPIIAKVPALFKELATDWNLDLGVGALAVGDFDGDSQKEIAAANSEGQLERIIVYDDANSAFERSYTIGRKWSSADGSTPQVRALAVSSSRACLNRIGRPMPATVAQANAEFPLRRNEVITATVNQFYGDATGGDLETRQLRVFGQHGWEDPTEGLRRTLAGLATIQLNLPDAAGLLSANFPAQVELWLRGAHMTDNVGTDGDFDFQMITMIGILYRFKNTLITPNVPTSFLLSNDAVLSLLLHDRICLESDDLAPEFVGPPGGPFEVACSFPLAGSGMVHHMIHEIIVPPLFPSVPETENHVLMINTWSYLVNQWLTDNPRKQPEITSFLDAHRSELQNADSELERGMLSFLGRVVKNDMWETNARPYSAYGMLPILMLAAYANDGVVKKAAQNAMDFLATKFAFESHEGRRYPTMRRNYKNRDVLGLYDNDYVPSMFGVLTGATIRDTSPYCIDLHCPYREAQPRGFALEAALAADADPASPTQARYRVQRVIHDFMLRPDNRLPGFGAWARMQARYTERHYLLSTWPRYVFPGPGDPVDLNQEIRDLVTPMEPAPEFYFTTRSYLNSAGGRHEEYHGFPDTIFVGDETERQLDVVTKPATLIAGEDFGYWNEVGGVEQDVLLASGSRLTSWASNNTGVYKNFTLGYDTERSGSPFRLPVNWKAGPEGTLGDATFMVVDPASTIASFPALDQLVVVGQLKPQSGTAALGFWEVVPRKSFASAQALLDRVLAVNAANNLSAGAPYVYTLVASGEKLTLNPNYPSELPFLAINGDAQLVRSGHMLSLSTAEKAAFPLIEVRQVDQNYRFTGTRYAFSSGDGVVTVTNPCLGQELVLNSSNHLLPTRVERPITATASSECTAAQAP